ncbi:MULTISPECIES: phosphatidate cytidylyltransferase [unclassified Micromonospora]|uniref:phosphatidate cytidylyltransferase n=1 Tax=unclassified Micromonospora TaxID=2617518 RepID=UPI003A8C6150
MSYPETAGGDQPDARTRARHPGAAPEPSAPETRNGHPLAERSQPYGGPNGVPGAGYGTAGYGGAAYGGAAHGGPLPTGPYTGTGDFPNAGSHLGNGGLPQAGAPTGNGHGNGHWSTGYRDGEQTEPSTDPDPQVGPDSSAARRRAGARRRRSGRSGPARPATERSDPDQPLPEPTGSRRAGQNPSGETGNASPAADRRPSAGRDLPAAIGVGLGLVVVVLGSLFLWRPAFLVVLLAAVSLGTWEMIRAVRTSGARPPMTPLLAGGALMSVLAWRIGPDALALGLLVTVLAMLIWRLGDGPSGYQRDAATATLITVYVPFLGGFAALLASRPDGDLQILVTLAAVILSDTGGYAAGVFYGRHRMAPTISPKKSWEGFAGSVAAAGIGSAVLLFLLLDVMPLWGALFGVAVSVAAVLGDLGESMLKRDLGVKDMSNLLPGHGGLMDRLDSILFALPVSYLVLSLIALAG